MISYTGGQGAAPSRNKRSGIPFLTREHMSTDKRTTEFLAVKVGQNQRGQTQISIKLNYGGVVYLWNLRTNNPNVQTLIELLGPNEERWAGKKVAMALSTDEFTGVSWPTVYPLEGKAR